jgi:hypothetical protein
MLPRRCIQPACTNIEVRIVNELGTTSKSAGSTAEPKKTAGMKPSVTAVSSSPPNSKPAFMARKTITFTAMMAWQT